MESPNRPFWKNAPEPLAPPDVIDRAFDALERIATPGARLKQRPTGKRNVYSSRPGCRTLRCKVRAAAASRSS